MAVNDSGVTAWLSVPACAALKQASSRLHLQPPGAGLIPVLDSGQYRTLQMVLIDERASYPYPV
jgi:hypothetical protein